MKTYEYIINRRKVRYFFNSKIKHLRSLISGKKAIVITDENIYGYYHKQFSKWECIVIPAGEDFKNQKTVDIIINRLIDLGVDRNSLLIGVGGGVVTDITGYVASIYMRGIDFGFIPTTLLAMVDAGVGGKNGIDVGIYKNMVGSIRQPSFILYDFSFLSTLPVAEYINGFAEIIKHACIKDQKMFKVLEEYDLNKLIKRKAELYNLIQQNALLKTYIVKRDEKEHGDRKLLNFGHTLGHAIENMYHLSHGHAVAIGMSYACRISKDRNGFDQSQRVNELIRKFELPVDFNFDRAKVFENMKKDKKKNTDMMSYILLSKIGKAYVENIPLSELKHIING